MTPRFGPQVVAILMVLIPLIIACSLGITMRLAAVVRREFRMLTDEWRLQRKFDEEAMLQETARLTRQAGVRRTLLTSALAQQGVQMDEQEQS